jgi:hypothetical protein
MQANAIFGDGMGHFGFLSIFLFLRNFLARPASKIAVNSRGCNTAVWLHFGHVMPAESPRNRFLAAT